MIISQEVKSFENFCHNKCDKIDTNDRHLKMMTRVGLVEHQCGNTMSGLAGIPETLVKSIEVP